MPATRPTYGLKPDVARVLVGDRASSVLFDETVALGADPRRRPTGSRRTWRVRCNKLDVDPTASPVTAQHIADLIALVADDTVSGAGAKQALEEAVATGDPIAEIVERKGLTQVSDSGALGAIADEVLAENPEVVEQFRGGKEAVIGFLVGQVMKKSAGSANPKLAKELLLERLSG